MGINIVSFEVWERVLRKTGLRVSALRLRTHLWKLVFASLVLWVLPGAARAEVELGIDVLRQHEFSILQGKRVGLVTNHTGIDADGVKTRKILANAKGVHLVALFAPEHGLDGVVEALRYFFEEKRLAPDGFGKMAV